MKLHLTGRIRTAAAALVVAVSMTVPAHAAVLYGLDSGGGGTAPLITVNVNTGAGNFVGNGSYTDTFGGFGVGLAYDGLTGIMYARSFDNLYTVDLNTGATTLIGPSTNDITGLTFDSGFSTLYSVSQFNGDFFSVDPNTGTATLIGNTGVNTPLGLSTRSDGAIFGASIGGDLYTIDTNTGLATILATGLPGFTEIAFDENDVLYGVTLSGDLLGTIDINNNIFNSIGNVGFTDVRGLAFAIDVAATPEPTTVALLGLSLVGLSVTRQRKTH